MLTCTATNDFFCARIDRMIGLRHSLAVFASSMPWQEIEAGVVLLFVREAREGVVMLDLGLFGEKPAIIPRRRNGPGW